MEFFPFFTSLRSFLSIAEKAADVFKERLKEIKFIRVMKNVNLLYIKSKKKSLSSQNNGKNVEQDADSVLFPLFCLRPAAKESLFFLKSNPDTRNSYSDMCKGQYIPIQGELVNVSESCSIVQDIQRTGIGELEPHLTWNSVFSTYLVKKKGTIYIISWISVHLWQ